MRLAGKVLIGTFFLMLLPAVGFAQADLCIPPLPSVPAEAKAEQLRIDAAERSNREAERRAWEVRMFTVKNALSDSALRALCIFRIEVVNQPALRLIQVRSPKSPELMAAIEDAVKRLDVPPVQLVEKGIELTGYVIVATDVVDPSTVPLGAALQPVANQLKSILPNGTLGLFDTFVVRGVDRQRLNLNGMTVFSANSATIREGSGASLIRLDNLNVTVRDSRGESIASLSTSIDVPVGTQVVIGKATPSKQGPVKAVILVINGKILD
jgi:hypothetical protein